ncbi:MAG: orotate phosphoribosyltransferase [Candidatus Bathyarchaeota archaeon]|nr:orotate phosphoribosyltransferase [Candidatus Bathyarchaeota archaeon]
MVENKKMEMAKILNKIGALQFGIFKLTSGKISPYYIDLRIVPSFPDVFRDICHSCAQMIISEVGIKNFDRIAGIPIAGIPFASQIAFSLKKPFLYSRQVTKHQGRERRVEGILVSGDRVLIVDDLVTTGVTIQKAADAVRAEGGVITDAVAFLDREEGGKEKLEKQGIKLHTLLRISEIANTLYELGAIDEENLKIIKKQIKKH